MCSHRCSSWYQKEQNYSAVNEDGDASHANGTKQAWSPSASVRREVMHRSAQYARQTPQTATSRQNWPQHLLQEICWPHAALALKQLVTIQKPLGAALAFRLYKAP